MAAEKHSRQKNQTPLIIVLVAVILVLGTALALPRIRGAKEEKLIETALREAQSLAKKEKYEEALERLDTALETVPDSAQLLEKVEEYEESLALLQEQEALAEEYDAVAVSWPPYPLNDSRIVPPSDPVCYQVEQNWFMITAPRGAYLFVAPDDNAERYSTIATETWVKQLAREGEYSLCMYGNAVIGWIRTKWLGG